MNRHTQNGTETDHETPSSRETTRRLLRDAVALAELQGRLLAVDMQQGLRTIRPPLALVVAGIVLALGCVPVGLLGLAALLAERVPLTGWQATLAVFAGAAGVAAVGVYGGWRRIVQRRHFLNRSRIEWRQNVKWIKDILRHTRGIEAERSGMGPPGERRP